MSSPRPLGAVLATNALHGPTLGARSTESILSQARRDGAVLCKGTGIQTADDLSRFLAPLVDGHLMPYFGGTNSRTSLSGDGEECTAPSSAAAAAGAGASGAGAGDVLDTGTEPPHIRLREHSEMAYVDRWPGLIIFGALQPPANPGHQGQTSVLKTGDLCSRLPQSFLDRLRREGLQHRLRYSDQGRAGPAGPAGGGGAPGDSDDTQVKSWQAALAPATTRKEADKMCADRGWTTEWSERSGTLTISYTRPAFARHPGLKKKKKKTKFEEEEEEEEEEEVGDEGEGDDHVLFCTDLSTDWYCGWEPFCHLPDDERPYSFRWGSGEVWSKEDGRMWAAAADACRYKHSWESGDVLIVDNMIAMHGREMYVGERKLGVVLAWPVDRDQPSPADHVDNEMARL